MRSMICVLKAHSPPVVLSLSRLHEAQIRCVASAAGADAGGIVVIEASPLARVFSGL
jgi:hypothetical protein